MRSIVTGVTVAMIFVFISASSSNARAGDKNKAKAHFETGLSLLEAEDFEGASVEFEISARMYPTKNGLFNLANCYKALHRYGDALKIIKRLNETFKGKLDQDWQNEIASFKADMNNLVANLIIKVSENNAVITIDGKKIGQSPILAPVLLGPGKHKIVVQLSGYVTVTRQIKLASKMQRTESFMLKKEVALLKITVNERGAEVLVDRRIAGTTPLGKPLKISPGSHVVTISKNGFKPRKKTIKVTAGQTAMLDISLMAVARQNVKIQPATTTSYKEAAPVKPLVERTPKQRVLYGVGVTSLVLTILSAGASGILYGMADKQYDNFNTAKDDWEDVNADLKSNPTNTALVDSEEKYWNKMNSSSQDMATFSNAGLALGITSGAFLVSTIVFLTISKPRENQPTAVHLVPTPKGLTVTF